MVALKPRNRNSQIEASLRYSNPVPILEGRLISPSDDPKVYLIHEGRKHWMTSVDWLAAHSMSLDQTIQVDNELLRSVLSGPALA